MICYKLNNLDFSNQAGVMRLLNSIKKIYDNFPDKENKVLVIKIQDIVCDDSNMIPKLELKNLEGG